MASRKEQKEQARQRRIEQEQADAMAAQRRQRLQIVGGLVAVAVVVIIAVIVISGSHSGPTTPPKAQSSADQAAAKRVQSLLAQIPQPKGTTITLGKSNAKVTITEYGDLECSACDELDLPAGVQSPDAAAEGYTGSGILDSVIKNYVRTGKAKLIYKSLETATGNGATPNVWTTQQAAANAAALQGKGWNYVELFYNEQGAEDTTYVTDSYLEGIAKQIPGLNYSKWLKDWKSNGTVSAEVSAQNQSGTQLDSPKGEVATPTLWVQGPGQSKLFVGDASYSSLAQAIKSAS